MDEIVAPLAAPSPRPRRVRKDIIARENLERITEAAWAVLEADLMRRKKFVNGPPKPGEPMHDLARAFAVSSPHLIDVSDDGAWLK